MPGLQLAIGRDDAGQRVDRFVRKYLPRATFSLVFKLLRTRQVVVNDRRAAPEDRLQTGDAVTLFLGERRLADLRGPGKGVGRAAPAAPPLEVLYRDADVLAVNKPARLLVHEGGSPGTRRASGGSPTPGAVGEPTLIDAVLRRFPARGSHTFRPALAHRLDRDTSGVVLVGLSAEGLRGLVAALRLRKVEKTYLALLLGVPRPPEGVVDLPLRREEFVTGRGPKVHAGGRGALAARTSYRVLAEARGLALVEARPHTGRTHQIRAHMAALGHPVLGDPTYGDRARNEEARRRHGLWRQFLHARAVALRHPVTGEPLRVEAPLPGELRRVLDSIGISLPASAGGGTPPPRPGGRSRGGPAGAGGAPRRG